MIKEKYHNNKKTTKKQLETQKGKIKHKNAKNNCFCKLQQKETFWMISRNYAVEIMQKKVQGNIQEILQSESTTHSKHQRNRDVDIPGKDIPSNQKPGKYLNNGRKSFD